MSYLRNTWYVAAWGSELAKGQVIARTLLDTRVALFRTESGRVAAVADRCPHRLAPLSMGKVCGEQIACGYHGLRFDADGACTLNPHGPIPKRLVVQSFQVHEAHRAIWIWMGDPAKANPAKIPDLSYLGAAPDTAFSSGYLNNQGGYEIYVDNILDLSHTDYLHPGTLAGGGITGTKPEVIEAAEHIEVTWAVRATPPLPALRKLVPTLPELTDSWTRVRWFAPAVMKLSVGAVAPGGREEEALLTLNAHAFTPQTATSCHYFFASTRNFATGDAAVNELFAQMRRRIFETEDKPMIEAIQRNMADAAGKPAEFWSLKPLMLAVDAAPVRVRRRLEALIAEELGTYKVEANPANG